MDAIINYTQKNNEKVRKKLSEITSPSAVPSQATERGAPGSEAAEPSAHLASGHQRSWPWSFVRGFNNSFNNRSFSLGYTHCDRSYYTPIYCYYLPFDQCVKMCVKMIEAHDRPFI